MSVVRHTAYNALGMIAPLVASLLLTPFYIHVIGVERYGLLAIFWTILQVPEFLNLGMGPAITQRFGRGVDATRSARSESIWAALIISLGTATIGAVGIYFGGQFYFAHFAVANGALMHEVKQAIPWLALSIFPNFARTIFNGALQGDRQFGWVNIVMAANAAMLLLAPLAFAVAGRVELPTLMIVSLAVICLSATALAGIVRMTVGFEAPGQIELERITSLFKFGRWVGLTSLLMPIIFTIDRLVIGAKLGAGPVAAYVLAFGVVTRLALFPQALSSAAMPRFAAATNEEERSTLQRRAVEGLLAVMTPVAIVTLMSLGPFLTIWIGPTLGVKSLPIGIILVIGVWSSAISHVPSTIVLSRGQPYIISGLLIAYVVPYLALLFLLIERLGLAGAALAWTIRSMFDFTLFYFTRPGPGLIGRIVSNFILIATATALALVLPWRALTFWLLMLPIAALALFLHRDALGPALRELPLGRRLRPE